MKFLFTIYFIVAFFQLSAQQTDDTTITIKTPYNPKGDYKNWGVKAIILPLLVGNGSGLINQLGVEYGITKNQTLGIDAAYIFFNDHREKATDTGGVVRKSSDKSTTKQKALFFNYRYYFYVERWRFKRNRAPYISLYYRLANTTDKTDPSFKHDYLVKDEKSNAIGIVAGAVDRFRSEKRLGIDYNIGLFYKQKNIDITYRENNLTKTKQETDSNFGLRIGLYIHYWFFR
jgi:hypothetical protein